MNTTPSIDELLEGLIFALSDEILPYLTNEKSQATAVMMQSVIQEIRQMLPVFDVCIAEEHNQMTKVLRDVAALASEVQRWVLSPTCLFPRSTMLLAHIVLWVLHSKKHSVT
jgi:hypothetical protein